MALIKASGTCMSFSDTAPATFDEAGYGALTWTPAVELRVAGELNATRAVQAVPRICTQQILNVK